MAKKSVFDGVYLDVSQEAMLNFEQTVLPQALAGDYEALTRVFFVCSKAIEQGQAPTPGLAAFMSDGLRAMAGGTEPGEAWHVQRKRGEKNTALAYANATRRTYLVELKRADGATYEEAVDQVAKAEHVSNHTVEHAWKTHHKKVVKREDGQMVMWTGPLQEEGE
jgi:hypothetical protein